MADYRAFGTDTPDPPPPVRLEAERTGKTKPPVPRPMPAAEQLTGSLSAWFALRARSATRPSASVPVASCGWL